MVFRVGARVGTGGGAGAGEGGGIGAEAGDGEGDGVWGMGGSSLRSMTKGTGREGSIREGERGAWRRKLGFGREEKEEKGIAGKRRGRERERERAGEEGEGEKGATNQALFCRMRRKERKGCGESLIGFGSDPLKKTRL